MPARRLSAYAHNVLTCVLSCSLFFQPIRFCQPQEVRVGVTRTFDADANKINVDTGIMYSDVDTV